MASLSIYLAAGCGALAGVVLWLGAFFMNKVRGVQTRQLLTATLAIGFIGRAAFLLLTPTFYAPDERPHFEYVKYLAEQHSLPVSTTATDEYFQPPLYYLLLTPFYSLAHALSLRDSITVRILRAFSILLWGITVLLAFKFLECLSVDDAFVKIFVVGMIALLPTFTFLSSVINNDNLILPIGAAILWLLVRPEPSLKNSALIGILLGLGLLTKLTAIVYAPLIALTLLMRFRKTGAPLVLLHLALSIIPALIIWSPWALRAWGLYGSLSGMSGTVPFEWGTAIPVIWGELGEINKTFWAVSGEYNNVSSFYPIVGKLLFYLSLAGLLYGLLFKRERLISLAREDAAVMLASALAILINLVLILILLYHQGQGRYLFPLLIPIALLMAVGLRVFPASGAANSRIHVSAFFITYVLSFICFSLAVFRA